MEITKNVVPLHSQSIREHSSVGLEHLPYKQRVRGSTPFAPTTKTTYSNVSRLFLCCFVWGFARSVGLAPLCVGCVGLFRCEHRATLPIPRRLRPTLLAVAIPSIGVCQAMSNVDTGLRGYVDFIARAKALRTAVSPPAALRLPLLPPPRRLTAM